mmetsp:Transcript_9069/g.22507  ORF Transcript_9069/g.22507 Transcript_9069/m.22507 type:complete len:120 (-) Transcript_9069:64-423(-)|eukprot:CAMPEP_0173470726 /NCGR_PEP_ID=MMETSP1357-20121228/78029_1 /TAXON_ID=77926 /ORGANISM="Hemiselmis rufescens, Strain PCC563" /LENGTH=119 /DNA_ID=CAMNT_0014439013 /DNA_START=554 /DNA_END=913 /DNA_ORIENTATION=-
MAEKTYQIKPHFRKKFKPLQVKQIIEEVMAEKLQGEKYHVDKAARAAKEITDLVKAKLKEMDWDRYKYVVQCVIGEQRGEGVKMGSRCYWDQDTDNSASATFSNDSLFCACVAFGVYLY